MIHNFVVVGAKGRMGNEIVDVILKDETAKLVGIIEREGHTNIGKNFGELILLSDIDRVNENINCIIDFSSRESSKKIVEFALKKKIPVVVGTTGFSNEEIDFFKESAKQIPILVSPNMSIGVNCLYMLTKLACDILSKEYSKEIIEIHHVNKLDAPSGTAKKLAEIMGNDKENICYGRHGNIGKRPSDEIGIHAVRGGEVVGEHTILFIGKNDRIEITHRAVNRKIFAEGAVKAAHFLSETKNGFFTMEDVIQSTSNKIQT